MPGKLFHTDIGYFRRPCAWSCSRRDFFPLSEMTNRRKEHAGNVFWFELVYLLLTGGNRGQSMISEI
jgi:hypothetical protein